LVWNRRLLAVVLLACGYQPARARHHRRQHKFRLLGPNDKIVIDGFDDPRLTA
jgi:catabolite regulation protein CreA